MSEANTIESDIDDVLMLTDDGRYRRYGPMGMKLNDLAELYQQALGLLVLIDDKHEDAVEHDTGLVGELKALMKACEQEAIRRVENHDE